MSIMMMSDQLKQPIEGFEYQTTLTDLLLGIAQVTQNCTVTGLAIRSDQVQAGDVFLALPGMTVDGRDYIDQAIHQGAVAVIYEETGQKPNLPVLSGVPFVGVSDLKQQLGHIASRFYGQPSQSIFVIGVTGTNGKTTVAYLVTQALALLGQECAYFGTLGGGLLAHLVHSDLTTADAIAAQQKLAWAKELGVVVVCMEVSSHGLDQGRVNGVNFDLAVFTNLSQDHLDYHKSMACYKDAKALLFQFPSLRSAIINQSDEFGAKLADSLRDKELQVQTYGQTEGNIRADNMVFSAQGTTLDLIFGGVAFAAKSKLLGLVNVPNILALAGCLIEMGYKPAEVVAVIEKLSPPPGRMEVFRHKAHQPMVVVDYAHTPDALECVLKSLKSLSAGRLITLFGCGGDRDFSKRPMMGRIAESLSDQVIITNDNPRSEAPEKIVAQIVQGMQHECKVIYDRRQAVREAIKFSDAKDIILLAGKGHEKTQIVEGVTLNLSDREFVPQLLQALA